MRMTAAEAMVKCLEEESVRLLFGLPGAAIVPFYDALSRSTIRHILVRQEQNAGHAASGYARMTGRPAVCVTTSGPGALNILPAVATAYIDSIPLIVITGQVSSELLGRDVFQEADITGSCEPFVKHSYLVSCAQDIPRIFKEAFHIAGTGRQGPVLIDIPVDIQEQEIGFEYPSRAEIRSYRPSIQGHPGQVKRVAAALKSAKRPLVCAGGGVFSAHAQDTLRTLLTQLALPAVTTMMGLSSIPPDYEKNLGMIGMYGSAAANRAMNSADVVLLIGARVGDRAIMSPMGLSRSAKIIHIDVDPAEIGKNIPTDIPLVGDARCILEQISALAKFPSFPDWTAALRSEDTPAQKGDGQIHPQDLIAALCSQAEPDAVLAADVGQHQIWAARGYNLPAGRFLTSGGMGTMGYSLPAAIGAKLACPGRQVIALIGDGGFQMNSMELATLCAAGLDLKLIIFNNGCLGMVKELQDRCCQGRETAVDLTGSPDFIALAGAYGIPSRRVHAGTKLHEAVRWLLSTPGAALLECPVSPDEPTL